LIKQKTIKKEFFLEGTGLQTGNPVRIYFYPSVENSGMVFARKDLGSDSEIHLNKLFETGADRRSRIGSGNVYVETVEHILAALWGAGISNIKMELTSSEPPAMDGSAALFLEAIEKAGIEEQAAAGEYIEITEPVWTEEKESFLGIFPGADFKVSYVLDYLSPSVGRQFYSEILTKETFARDIAPARTFCLKKEAEMLVKQGYGKGADFKNTLVMDEKGPIENELRFPNEPVRHKVLDLVGDLYLLGRPLKGRVIAIRSGHKLNLELVAKIKERLCK